MPQCQLAIDEISASANAFYKKLDFEMAATRYSQALNLLIAFKQRKPNDLGHAFWNFAMANISWASQLQLTDLNKARLLKDQAKLQIQEALLAYPASAKKHLRACQAKLTELTMCLVEDEKSQSFIDVEEISSEQIEKPPVLHWKKALLQRYLAEQQATDVSAQESQATERPTCKS